MKTVSNYTNLCIYVCTRKRVANYNIIISYVQRRAQTADENVPLCARIACNFSFLRYSVRSVIMIRKFRIFFRHPSPTHTRIEQGCTHHMYAVEIFSRNCWCVHSQDSNITRSETLSLRKKRFESKFVVYFRNQIILSQTACSIYVHARIDINSNSLCHVHGQNVADNNLENYCRMKTKYQQSY